jgi:6-pyruvoyltetrahydropterin/6-carboxytetrahydropterin synthase
MWIEDNWDHKFLLYEWDPIAEDLKKADPEGIVIVPFNPTAENMAHHLLTHVGPKQLSGEDCILIEVKIEETAKCSASAKL